MFKCECGKEFEKQSSLNSHARFCKLYKKKDKKVSKYKINDNIWKCECGKEFNKAQSLNAHLSHCDYHHEYLGTYKKLRPSELYHTNCWENKTEEEIKEIRIRQGKTYSQNIKNGKYEPVFKGKHHSEESKQKTRESTIKYIKDHFGNVKCRYNKRQIQYINKLNEEKHWHLQHAESENGEYCVLGYYLDGYDKDLNIAFEYDEVAHYKDKENNILTDKDIQRQNNIINKLCCEFWRYNEYLDLLYKVN